MTISDEELGRKLMDRLSSFSAFTDEPGQLTRLYLSTAHQRAARKIEAWMIEAGMVVTRDAVANIVGRFEGIEPDAPALLFGSHIDTVRDAGRYDGALGVLGGIAAVDALHRAGERFRFAIEVIAFGDEEGIRFPSTLSGSRALAGVFDSRSLSEKDQSGITLAEALRRFGCDPAAIPKAAKHPDEVLGYVELHIEQGPLLEAVGQPLGIVTAICGATRLKVTVDGKAGHAGTTPMELRHDALAGAAQMLLAVERHARERPELVATVGQIAALPGAVNVIPGSALFSVDLRSARDEARITAARGLQTEFDTIAARRGLRVSAATVHEAAATRCDLDICGQLAAMARRLGVEPMYLPSGAGHDAMVMAGLCPVGMLLIRCQGGISHSPAEAITVEDAGMAVRALMDFIRHFHEVRQGLA